MKPPRKRTQVFLFWLLDWLVIVMAFCPEIIKIFAAPEYYDARWIVPPVVEALLFMFIFPLFCNVEFYFAQTKFIMVASSVAALTNVCLNYIGIRLFGYIAAAIRL